MNSPHTIAPTVVKHIAPLNLIERKSEPRTHHDTCVHQAVKCVWNNTVVAGYMAEKVD